MTATHAEDLVEQDSSPVRLTSSDHGGQNRSVHRRRLMAYAVVLAVVAAAILGGRMITHHAPPRALEVTVAHPAAAFPASPAVEAAWGLRFTNVIVLADNGGVELRYQVTDAAKAGKIHMGDQNSNQLPSITVEPTNATIKPSAVLMHFHHGDATAGQTYSIIYGNAGGVVVKGEFVTIVMKDGLKIKHIEVSD